MTHPDESAEAWEERQKEMDAELEKWRRRTHPYLVDISNPERNWVKAHEWCHIHLPDFSHVGGRFQRQLAFETEEEAVYFKLHWG